MTEEEKQKLIDFINILSPSNQDSWKDRAIRAEETILKIKNTIAIAKNLKISYPMMHDAIAQLVFRWNESEALREQISEIDKRLNNHTNWITARNTLEKIEHILKHIGDLNNRNNELNKQVTDYKRYCFELSEELVRKSL